MNTITFSTLITNLESRVFPFGTPENVEHVVSQLATEALIQIQRYVDSYREGHLDVFETSANILQDCGASSIPRPNGKIHRISNRLRDDDEPDGVATDDVDDGQDDCDVFTYDLVGREEVERSSNELRQVDLSAYRQYWGNAWVGPLKIVLTPQVRDNERVELEWSGIKRVWYDDDAVPDDADLFSAVCSYVAMEVARKYDRDVEAFNLSSQEWREHMADMMSDARTEGLVWTPPRLEPMTPMLTFSFVADCGLMSGGVLVTEAVQVARLIHSWNPDVLLFGGDNNYPSGAVPGLDIAWGPWKDDIKYSRVFAALGNHDVLSDAGQPQISYLSPPGNGRYFSFVRGPVEFFVNSASGTSPDANEPDGITDASVQGLWLQAQLAASKATWKVVVLHVAPYNSDVTYSPGNLTMRWPFATWGADVVLSGHGHVYERIENTIPYFVVGTGGSVLRAFGAPTTGTQQQYNALHGALRVTADRNKMIFRFYNVDGELKDVHSIAP